MNFEVSITKGCRMAAFSMPYDGIKPPDNKSNKVLTPSAYSASTLRGKMSTILQPNDENVPNWVWRYVTRWYQFLFRCYLFKGI